MTSLQQETVRCELTTVALRLDRLARTSPNHGIRVNAAIRLARIKSVLRDLENEITLNELLDAMDANNFPEPLDWGPPVGKEIW